MPTPTPAPAVNTLQNNTYRKNFPNGDYIEISLGNSGVLNFSGLLTGEDLDGTNVTLSATGNQAQFPIPSGQGFTGMLLLKSGTVEALGPGETAPVSVDWTGESISLALVNDNGAVKLALP